MSDNTKDDDTVNKKTEDTVKRIPTRPKTDVDDSNRQKVRKPQKKIRLSKQPTKPNKSGPKKLPPTKSIRKAKG